MRTPTKVVRSMTAGLPRRSILTRRSIAYVARNRFFAIELTRAGSALGNSRERA
jgi:hypothetical protein